MLWASQPKVFRLDMRVLVPLILIPHGGARMKFFFGLLALVAWQSTCFAVNVAFLQGDAFFPTSFNERELIKFIQSKSPAVSYSVRSAGDGFGGAGCGSAGHWILQFPQLTQHYRQGLHKAYQEFKQDHLVRGEVFVLVYPAEFDLDKFRLCLQYNENWVAEGEKYDANVDHLPLMVLPDPRWTSFSWRDAPRVPPLPVTLVETPQKRHGPVRLTGEFKFVMLPSKDYDDYCSLKEGSRIIVIDRDAITEYIAKSNHWTPGKRETATP